MINLYLKLLQIETNFRVLPHCHGSKLRFNSVRKYSLNPGINSDKPDSEFKLLRFGLKYNLKKNLNLLSF